MKSRIKEILKQAKEVVRAIIMDQDGTIKGGNDHVYQKANIQDLLRKIARAGKHPAIITASGASALKSLSSICDFYAHKPILPSMYIGIGNGMALYRFDKKGKTKIYHHGLSINEEKFIMMVWQELCKTLGVKESDIQLQGIETFKKFIRTDWAGYIPSEYLKLCRQYGGQCFTELIKVTIVLPAWDAEKQRRLVKQMQLSLNVKKGKNKYIALRGDGIYMHVTRFFDIDPKLFALRTIMKELNLMSHQVAVFGDLPLDNDRGLLVESELPYAFTNNEFGKYNVNKPPYIIPGSSISPVGSVYKIINYLLS